jgi:hypothetical protein
VDEYFVGRAAELAVLDGMLQGAVSGSSQFAVVAGPAWIGKTTLIRHFLDARLPRSRRATGDEDETALAGGLLEQLGIAAESGAEPSLAGPALVATLREWARADGTAVLVIDDAQWGDHVSLSAVSYALRRLRDEPLLVILAVRDDGYAHLPPGLVRMIGDRGVTIELAGSTRPASESLPSGPASARCPCERRGACVSTPMACRCTSGRCCTRCRGNPCGRPCRRPRSHCPSPSPWRPAC